MELAIEASALTKRFGSTIALDDATFSVGTGDIFGLVGPSGAGKTTLLYVLLNLHRPISGSALILGRPAHALAPRDFQEIGFVTESQHIPDTMTIAQYLAYLKPFYEKWDNALAERLLFMFDLPRKRPLKHLSRGMRMKALFVSSLAFRPKLLLMDEPFSGLDPLVRDEILTAILRTGSWHHCGDRLPRHPGAGARG